MACDWYCQAGLTQSHVVLAIGIFILVFLLVREYVGMGGKKRVEGVYNSDSVHLFGRRLRNTQNGDYLKIRSRNSFDARDEMLYFENAPALPNARFPSLEEMIAGCPEATVFPEDPAGLFLGDKNASTLVYVPSRATSVVASRGLLGAGSSSVIPISKRADELRNVLARDAAEIERVEREQMGRRSNVDKELQGAWFLDRIAEPVGKMVAAGVAKGMASKGGSYQSQGG